MYSDKVCAIPIIVDHQSPYVFMLFSIDLAHTAAEGAVSTTLDHSALLESQQELRKADSVGKHHSSVLFRCVKIDGQSFNQ